MVVGSIGTYMQTPERSLKLDYNLEQVNPCVYDCAATTCGFPKDGIFKWYKELRVHLVSHWQREVGVFLGVPEVIGSEVEAWHSFKIVQLLNE